MHYIIQHSTTPTLSHLMGSLWSSTRCWFFPFAAYTNC